MGHPAFFDQVPAILLHDGLGEFLGAFEGGTVEISYYDCAKLAGHSCPTVASAYLMAKTALSALFPDTLPKRSQIRVELRADKEEGVTGVIASVISFIVGANDEGGFKGIGASFSRNNLLQFGQSAVQGTVRLTRMDTQHSISVSVDTKSVPGSAEMMPLMQKSLQGAASPEEHARFQKLWQDRVKSMLLDTALQETIITTQSEDS